MKYYNIMFYVALLASSTCVMTSFCSEEVIQNSHARASGRSHNIDRSNVVVYEKPCCVVTLSHLAVVTSVRFNRRCDHIVTTTPDNGLAYIWDIHNEQEPLLVCDHKKKRPLDAWFSKDEKYIFTKIEGRDRLCCWSTKSGKDKGRPILADVSRQMDYSRDTHILQCGGGAVLIVDRKTKKTIQRISHSDGVTSVKWNKNGTQVASSAGSHAYVWRVGKTAQEIDNQRHNRRVLARVKRRPLVEAFSETFGS